MKNDSTAGKLMEKAGAMFNHGGLQEKGQAKRAAAGNDDTSSGITGSGTTGSDSYGSGNTGSDSYGSGNTGSGGYGGNSGSNNY